MRLQDYDTMTRFKATVLRSERITAAESKEEVREILIEVKSQDFDAGVGQNIGVLAPGQKEIGQEHHFRLYSVADLPETTSDGNQRLCICVRRCSYIDEFSGEEYPGVASNYLCDLSPGATLTITGPYGQPFELPQEPDANLILICAGTGIAPFRAFVKQIYILRPDFKGRIWLFHGGQTGLDLLYRNDEKNDFALYYDRDTFEAFDALSQRPGWNDQSDWGTAMHARGEQLCKLLAEPKTYVYLAGLEQIRDELDEVLAEVAGSNQTWFKWKTDLQAEGRWIELLY
jgi:ferredoxin--NADP+ reductase